jgi:beta-phosphoglucomutase-like phosphatase (HAD superfamily)
VQSSISSSFIDFFDTIVTGEMTIKNKPNPDPFKLAAKKLNSLSSECLVFENAPLGIIAAKKAKMTCVAITNTNDHKELLNADFVINKYNDIYNDKKIKKILYINEKI